MTIMKIMKSLRFKKGSGRNLLGLLVFAAITIPVLIITQPNKPDANQHTEHASSEVNLTHCSTEDTCKQEEHYRQIVETTGVKEAFTQLRADYEVDESVRSNCHPLAHVIGRVAGLKFATVSAAYAEGDEFCWSGYYHGVMEAILSKMKPEDVGGKLNEICADLRDSKMYSFDHYNCVHGLGHGVMLITGHELFDSLRTCDNLADSWERESCYGGVYMENIMASTNPNHRTSYINNNQPLYPCTAVAEKYKQQCYLMQTSHALTVVGGDFAQVFSLCGGIEAIYQATCYQSLGRDASGRSISNAATTHTTCLLGPNTAAVTNCMVGAVKDFVSYHHSDTQAKELCGLFQTELANICLAEVAAYYKVF